MGAKGKEILDLQVIGDTAAEKMFISWRRMVLSEERSDEPKDTPKVLLAQC
jgi:hypothetical protein